MVKPNAVTSAYLYQGDQFFMKKSIFRKTVKWTAVVVFFLIAVVAIHVYVVTRPRVDARTRVMARIDIHESISQAQADVITAWLYRQKGVDHVLCNAATDIVIFTFSPMNANADEIAGRFGTSLHYPHAARFVPTQKQMSGSCPAGF